MRTGAQATLQFTVSHDDTAAALGSGDLPVLGTPRLLAWCEAVTCAALADDLEPGRTSVGTRVSVEHTAPSPVGARLHVEASVAYADGRLVRFHVAATQEPDGAVVATGEVTRVVVDADRFLARVSPPA